MSFVELAKSRYSVRNFLPDPVEDEKLEYILECGRIAPSAANFQPWHIVVVKDPDLKSQICEAYPRKWIYEAPVLLVLCGDHITSWKRADHKDHCDIDIAILADHLTLAAADAGLGTCWVCAFDAKKVSGTLQLPSHIEPVVLLPLGYPGKKNDDRARHLVRKELKEIVHKDKF